MATFQDQQRAQLYGDRLMQQSVLLQRAVLVFMTATLYELIPPEKFGAVICAGCTPTDSEGKHSILERFRIWKALPDDAEKPSFKDPSASDEYLAKVLSGTVSSQLRRDILSTMDLQSCFKLFIFLPESKAGCSLLALARAKCPAMANMEERPWRDTCRAAINLRNAFAHASTSMPEAATAGSWQHAYTPWMRVVELLRCDATRTEYDGVREVYDGAADISFHSISEIAREMQGVITAEQIEEKLGQGGFTMADGFVSAKLDDILRYLSEEVRKEEERAREQREREELLAENQALAEQNRLFLEQGYARQKKEADIRYRMAQKKLDKIPALHLLRQYEGGDMDQRTLQELVRTHNIILSPSLLNSAGGKYFLGSRLLPCAKSAERPLYMERTAMLRLIRDIDRLDTCRRQYQALAPLGDGYAEERRRLEDVMAPLEQAKGSYVFATDMLKVKLLGIADPLYSDDDALVRTLEEHPFERYCIFISGATELPRLIDRAKLPFVTLVRVHGNELTGVGCMVFRHFLPFANADIDEPLVQPLLQASFSQTDRLLAMNDADAAKAASPAPAPAPDTVAVSAPAQPARNGAERPEVSVSRTEYFDPFPIAKAVPAAKEPAPAPQPAGNKAAEKPEVSVAKTENNEARAAAGEHSPGETTPAFRPVVSRHDAAPAPAAQKPARTSNALHGTAPFAAGLPLRQMDETPLPFPGRPESGMVLYTEDHQPVTLGNLLTEDGEPAEGGEGMLFLTDTEGCVAKLYNQEHLTVGRRDKLAEMLLHDPGISGLCWPTHMLYTKDGVFCGYTMPRAPKNAMPFAKSVLKIGSPSQRKALMASWTRKDLIRTALSAAHIVAQLHKNNILMGDVNGGNFMVDLNDSSRVFVVDTDSFQFGGFPCPVGIEKFTHPGIRERLGIHGPMDFKTILRNENEDDYAFAILVFEILFLGQNPFATKTDLDFTQAMAQRRFAYAAVDRSGKDFEVPDGDNWMIWKNLPKKVTEAFGHTFIDWKSTTAAEWEELMASYLHCVEKLGFSDELSPAKYREFTPDNPVYMDLVCPFCKREFNLHRKKAERLIAQGKPIFCRNCRNSLENHKNDRCRVTCSRCGKAFDTTVEQAILIESNLAEALCEDCRTREVTCGGCGRTFRMDRKRYDELKEKGTRDIYCPDCAKAETVVCECCGESYTIPHGKKRTMESRRQNFFCPKCWKRVPATCSRCGNTFRITVWQQKRNNDMHRQPICEDCRKQFRPRRG